MAPLKCCVNVCDSTSETQKLFCMPKNDNLRNLWMSFLVPTSPYLLLLSKDQLMTKRVCRKHFDQTQFDEMGVRIRYSYPCLFKEEEFFHGVPLRSDEYNVLQEHNYVHNRELEEDTQTGEQMVLLGMPGNVLSQEHLYGLPSSSQAASKLKNEGVSISILPLAGISEKENIETELLLQPQPSTSKGISASRTPLADISHVVNIEASETRKRTPKQTLSKGICSFKQFKSKTRRFIKETSRMATDSLGHSGMERLQRAQQTQAEQVELIENFMSLNKKSKAFLLMQLRLARKNKLARRFSLEEKIFALTLLKQSPKGYKLLQHIFALPTKRTLARLAEKITFECGLNQNTIEYIKKCTNDWDDKKKLCSIVFDEVALTPHLIYNEHKDIINGFVDIAGERKQKFADHALVFMVRGICSPWRQSIAYYFCAGTVSAPELERILKQLIPKLVEAGLQPLAIVCDQGSTFRSCFKNIKQSNLRDQLPTDHERRFGDTINVAGQELFIFHDPPHLLKGIRNNFLNKDILFEGKRASWEDILYIYDLDNKSGHTRALPKLTADHVDPKKMKKMKVKIAAQVLSARTAAMLNYTDALHRRLGNPKETMKTTAEVVLFFDELFDSVNGSPGQGKGKLRCAVKNTSVHMDFWRASLKKLREIKYIDTKSKLAIRAGQPRHVRVPSLEGWSTTLKSFLGLSKMLFEKYNVEYFYPRLVNQDPLENFFGRIRAFNYRNVNPDVNAFVYTFKSLAISSILMPQSKFANCEEDDGDSIIDLSYLFASQKCDKKNITVRNIPAPSSSSHSSQKMTVENVIFEKVNVQTSAYTAGYMCRKITKRINCNACSKTYTTKEVDQTHDLITHREYKRLKNNNLTYPNGRILRLYREAAQIIHGFLNQRCHHKEIKTQLFNMIATINMSWLGCKVHNKQIVSYFISLIIRLHVHNWCNIINKILNGKIEEKYVSKVHNMHIAALNKFKTHRLRQKALKSHE